MKATDKNCCWQERLLQMVKKIIRLWSKTKMKKAWDAYTNKIVSHKSQGDREKHADFIQMPQESIYEWTGGKNTSESETCLIQCNSEKQKHRNLMNYCSTDSVC